MEGTIRRAVVTGAASGIGAALARRLHSRGIDLVLAELRAADEGQFIVMPDEWRPALMRRTEALCAGRAPTWSLWGT